MISKPLMRLVEITVISLLTIAGAHATTTVFLDPSRFSGQEVLIQFDGSGLSPSDEFRSLDSVQFALLDLDTLNDTGFGPTLASAPNSTFPREFPPTDGPDFLSTINPSADDVDLQITLPGPVTRVAAEIRSGQAINDVDDLTFELYNGSTLVGSTTLAIRGLDNFFFYGLESTEAFDRWVIRQRPDSRFELENLRFEVPDSIGTPLILCVLGFVLAAGRRRRL
jgi:hypothetical protein